MELNEKQKQKINEVAKKYSLRLVLLFGSRVDGKIHKESDYDIAYLPKKDLTFYDEVDINLQFTNIFGHDRVDTVNMRKTSPLLLYAVFRKCQVLFEKDNLIFPTYRVYAFKKYVEVKPILEKVLLKNNNEKI